MMCFIETESMRIQLCSTICDGIYILLQMAEHPLVPPVVYVLILW